MAYNPFNIFRRNQKAIFAVVTVFIMFTFVLSSGVGGGADFFDWLPRWLGSKSKRGDVIATIDGTKIYDSELTDPRKGLRYQRVMANRYMSYAAGQTSAVLDQMVSENINRLSPEGEKLIAPVRQAESMINLAFQNPQFAEQLRLDIPALLGEMRASLGAMINSPTLKSEDKDIARAKLAILAIQQSRGGSEHYFGNTPNVTESDLLNFMLWQKKADQLGIKLTKDDVKELVQREFFGYFQARSQIDVQKAMAQSMPGFTMDEVLKALGEEYRVRLAQTLVLGDFAHGDRIDKTEGGFPAFSTPHDSFDYFREQASPTTFAAIPIPVENFIALVPEPDENDPKVRDELKRLFQQYKDDEPNPARESPGFKSPRKARVAWFSVTGNEPYFLQMAEERLKLGTPVAKTGAMLTVPVFGISPVAVAAATAPIVVKDALLEDQYRREFVDPHRSQVDLRWARSAGTAFEPLGMLLDTSVLRPGNMGVAAGAVTGQTLGFGNPFAVAAAVGAGAISYEIRDRVKAGVPLVLGTVPGWGMFNTVLSGEVAFRKMVPQPLPIDSFRPTLLRDLTVRNAREMAAADMKKFIEEVNRLSENGKAKDMKKAQEFINEFVARRGLKVTESETPRTEWNIAEDPALAPLVAVQRESLQAASSFHGQQQQRGYVPFGEKFFWATSPRGAREAAVGTFAPIFYPTEVPLDQEGLKTKSQHVVWRTAEVKAEPKGETAAMPEVKLAWKRIRARELARKRAEQLAETIRAANKTSEQILVPFLEEQAALLKAEFAKDPKAQTDLEPFLIRGVAPLTSVTDPTGRKGLFDVFTPTMSFGALQPFQLPASENLKYPTEPLARTLMDDRQKGPKTVHVLPDAPKDIFFVTTLLKREPKTDLDFKTEVVGGELSERFGGREVLNRFRNDARRNAYQSIIGLLKKEFKFELTDEQKKRLEENEKRGLQDV